MAAYIDHVAYLVTDLDWYLRFFETVYDMTPERSRVEPDGSTQVWLEGGVQLRTVETAPAPGGSCDHLCLLVEDLENVREKAMAMGCLELPGKHHWVKTPDGLKIEMFEAAPGAVAQLRALRKHSKA